MAATVEAILEELVGRLGVESGAVVIRDPSTGDGDPTVAAAVGLPEVAVAGLTAAMRDPDHPVTRTFGAPAIAFDVRPSRPGGPALRSHVPLSVDRGGTAAVLGVLALAYDRPMSDEARAEVLEDAARLAAALDAGR